MGMIACYTMINDSELEKLYNAKSEEILEQIENLTETHEILDIDKMWDGLHFLLTGVSASTPFEDDPISETIVGVVNLNEDDFIAYTRHEELTEINDTLDAIDFEKLRANFQPLQFKDAEIYPNIWEDTEKDQLFDELKNAFDNLRVFYKQAELENMNIVVSIY